MFFDEKDPWCFPKMGLKMPKGQKWQKWPKIMALLKSVYFLKKLNLKEILFLYLINKMGFLKK